MCVCMYVFTYLGIKQAMSVSKVPWGQREFWDRRPKFGLIGDSCQGANGNNRNFFSMDID